MNLEQLRATDPEKTTVYVDFVEPIKGQHDGRLIDVGWRYARVILGNREIITCDSEEIACIR